MSERLLHLRNSRLELLLNPDRGANIQQIFCDGEPWLFFDESRKEGEGKNPHVYDDVWCGGFEELFPNDAPGILDGRELEDHGELWSRRWEIVLESRYEAVLSLKCKTVPATVGKVIKLDPDLPRFTLEYTLRNESSTNLFHLFKLHAAMRIEPGDRIDLPGGTVTPVDLAFSRIVGSTGPFTWPWVEDNSGGRHDLSVVPPRARSLQEFVYVADLPAGWCGLERARSRRRIVLRYPLSVFPFCWLFMSFGGWRDYYTVVLEPCTNMPKDLNQAKERGVCAVLQPGEVKTISVLVEIE